MTLKKVHDISLRRVDSKSVVAYASIFNVVDLQGDRVLAGAFANSIRRWKASGDSPAFCWSHDWSDPFALLGKITDMREDGRGLLITAQVDEDTDFSRQVMKLLRNRIVTQFSFSYDVVHERKAEDGANELIELDLIEAGPCLRGANNQTELISAKALMKAAHKGGTVIMDASDLERPYDPRATAWWHVEERGIDFAVVSEATGEEVGRFPTRGEAVARLVELEANNVGSKGDPRFWQRAVEEAAAGRKYSPERFAAERQAWAARKEEAARSSFEHEQLAKVQRPIPDTITWVEGGSESADVPETSTEQVAAFEDDEPVRIAFGPGMQPIEKDVR
jgi:HK97 family phage prohead protease